MSDVARSEPQVLDAPLADVTYASALHFTRDKDTLRFDLGMGIAATPPPSPPQPPRP